MKIKFYASDISVCGHIRGEIIARVINESIDGWSMDMKEQFFPSDLFECDVAVFQRCFNFEMLEQMRQCRDKGIATIYEIDDDLFNIPREFDPPYSLFARGDVQNTMSMFLHEADLVSVSTEALGLSIGGRCPATPKMIVPNLLDVDQWDEAYQARLRDLPNRNKLTIGYFGSAGHIPDVKEFIPTFVRLMEEFPNVYLHFVGGWLDYNEMPIELLNFKARIRVDPWAPIAKLPLALKEMDIGIAPLADNIFNDCKSNIKALQYWALGIPVVATDLAAYSGTINHGVDGFRCKRPEDFYSCLRSLCAGPVKDVYEMGQQGRARVEQDFDVRNNIGSWINTITAAMAINAGTWEVRARTFLDERSDVAETTKGHDNDNTPRTDGRGRPEAQEAVG